MKIVVGVDQGNTHTCAAVSDLQGRILGVGRSYGACHYHSGVEKAMAAIREAAARGFLTTLSARRRGSRAQPAG